MSQRADVIVVGAGPGGSCAAYHLARQGLDVLLLEKSELPREKVCGDGLSPRAVRQLVRMGVDLAAPGWSRNRGVRFVAGDARLEVAWPGLASLPDYGLTRTRRDFDDLLARRAAGAGARLRTRTRVTAPLLDRAGRVAGVHAEVGPERTPATYRAPLVVAADGVSARLALALDVTRRTDRPMGVAVRRYYRSPARHADDHLEIWFDLRLRDGRPLPGYAWVFGIGDGRVNVGLGSVDEAGAGRLDHRRLLREWLATTPVAWGLREETGADGAVRGAALPMGFSRVPHYTRGLMLVGDSGGMVNPCNGEGIAYAMEAGELAADIAAQALARPEGPRRERALRLYPAELTHRHGAYYRVGSAFAGLMTRPFFPKLLHRAGMRSPATMRLLVRLLSNVYDRPGRDATDHAIEALLRLVPSGAPGRRRSG
ncbi:geranylgeranyl reductase family protein [Allostreptomyces psammosilenae]|uniref:Geranylgeranyl reductase family protein n=1 Tax=Allostreptomyces psammosilenae TaxID=1892865 RepID=A0A852ZQS5_9ACTN|nr:geranylgeranyl reductase family protein [Allostreptomyces psammosilenae]NYI04753.1 geranylgeranyl reductase family protein [Allostreptomyces psammosilenae]